MAKAGQWTINGRCRWCRAFISWEGTQRADGTYSRPFDAAMGTNGLPIYKLVSGKPRPTASSSRHSCASSDVHARSKVIEHSGSSNKVTALDADTVAATATATATDLDKLVDLAAGRIRAELIAKLGITERFALTVNTIETGTTDDPRHPSLETLLLFMSSRQHTYACGPAGSGKSHGAVQAAKLLGLRSVIVPCAGAPASRLLGQATVTGETSKTVLQDFWLNGGVFVADEFDRMLPSATAAVNSLLANGIWVINEQSCPAHRDFVFSANGNTDLRGATEKYISAQRQDVATISRFAFVDWPYDLAHESAIVLRINPRFEPVITWARALRHQLEIDNIDVLAGPRELHKMATMMATTGASLRAMIDSFIWRGYPKADVERYEAMFPVPRLS